MARTAAAARQAERLSAESRTRRGDAKIYSAGNGRSPARATALIVGAVIAVVVVLVLVLTSGGGGKPGSQGAAAGQSTEKPAAHTTTSSHTHKQASSHHSESPAAATSPAATSVVVLNSTNTTGLARKLSENLRQSGYSQATALSGRPPESHATTLVEYASGHRAEAQGAASALSVTQVQPMEAAVASLTGTAVVVVIAGADKAAAVSETPGGGGASSATSG
jgi:hypothetical protein